MYILNTSSVLDILLKKDLMINVLHVYISYYFWSITLSHTNNLIKAKFVNDNLIFSKCFSVIFRTKVQRQNSYIK